MNIHEFQGKDLFRRYAIPTPDGRVVGDAEAAEKAAQELGGTVVAKAQIHAGGRGQGTLAESPDIRGVRVCKDATEARDHAEALLGKTLITHQTGPEGRCVKRVLIEKASAIKDELYAAVVLDRDRARVSLIVSTEGGMDIEAVAQNTPEKIVTVSVDPVIGLSGFHTRRLVSSLGLRDEVAKKAKKVFRGLYDVFVATDASLVEVNPLVVTADDDVIALDAKINFDANALFRHPELVELRDVGEEDPKETQANDAGLSYVALDGTIGCLVNGAGLAMATMDIIKFAGGEPANFLDVGGGATEAQVTTAFKIILADANVKAILVNIFGGIARCDVIANGVVAAAEEVGLSIPLVVRLEGTNVEQGKEILSRSGLAITAADDMADAAKKVVAAAGGGK